MTKAKKDTKKKVASTKATVKKKVVSPKKTQPKSAPKKKAVPTIKKKAPAKSIKKSVTAKKVTPKKKTPSSVVKKTVTPKNTVLKKAIISTPASKTEKAKKPKKIGISFPKISIPKILLPRLKSKKSVDYSPKYTKSILEKKAPSKNTERYSDMELAEFKTIILKKLEKSKRDLLYLQESLSKKNSLGEVDDLKIMTAEEGSLNMEIDHFAQMASRTKKFIDNLEKALIRIENKTYGVCRKTGKLIDKDRLKAVPHATLSIEAKQNRQR